MSAIRESVLRLSKNGLSQREIGRRLGRSHTQVQRILDEGRPPVSGDPMGLLAALERAGITNFAIEREGRRWKVVNLAMRLGARTETARHVNLVDALGEALSLWA